MKKNSYERAARPILGEKYKIANSLILNRKNPRQVREEGGVPKE